MQELKGEVLAEVFAGIEQNVGLFVLILLLALLNWNGEAQKFKLLISSEVKLRNIRAFLTILGGMAISNFTPARTGEYIGRGLLLKKIHPIKVVIATIAGNLTQVLMTYSLGLVCVSWVLMYTDILGTWSEGSKLGYVAAMFVLIIALVLNARKIVAFIKPRLPEKLAETLNIVNTYDRGLYRKVVALAFGRYVVFAVQFYLLLQMFSGFALPLGALVLVPVAYLMQSVVPVPAISDVGVRVFVSQLLFGSYLGEQSILLAVSSLWFINLILPGLAGTVYLLISTLRNR